jgi:hypothetical protein
MKVNEIRTALDGAMTNTQVAEALATVHEKLDVVKAIESDLKELSELLLGKYDTGVNPINGFGVANAVQFPYGRFSQDKPREEVSWAAGQESRDEFLTELFRSVAAQYAPDQITPALANQLVADLAEIKPRAAAYKGLNDDQLPEHIQVVSIPKPIKFTPAK